MIGSDKRVNTRVKIFSVAFQKGEGGGGTYTEKGKNKNKFVIFPKKILENFLWDHTKK